MSQHIQAVGLGALLLAGVACRENRLTEITHEGKTVEQWFEDYVASRETRSPANTSPVRNGEFLPRTPDQNPPDPAWTAFQALGEKAIPALARYLNPPDKTATTERAQLARSQAIDLIHRLGATARRAAPALLALLKEAETSEAEAVCAAIAYVRPEPQLINEFLVDLGKSQRNADLLRYARRLGWSGPDVAQTLGRLLPLGDRETAYEALVLLEAAGPEAQAATEQIVSALNLPNEEIRYLAARSLAQLAPSTPAAGQALQGLTNDPNGMVRTVARKAMAGRAGLTSDHP